MMTINMFLWRITSNQGSVFFFLIFAKHLATLLNAARIVATPMTADWMVLGTSQYHWQEAHIGLIVLPPAFNLYNPTWIIITPRENGRRCASTGAL